ncbi:MAG: nicotinate-nucleotide adenylyltransferase [Chloroflexi bacterium]|nr:nicotinate-nucleotide adenylyltransferase [Chloroflexota bacterium]
MTSANRPAAAGPGALPTVGAWGVLGGTFDPVHCAHLAIAEQARDVLGLAGVLFVPARVPPHKLRREITPIEDRIAMVELATAANPAFHVSRIEVDRDGPNYTVDTIERLLADPPQPWNPDAGLIFILSAEALVGLETWHLPERLLGECRLAVVPRRGYPVAPVGWMAEHFPGFEDRVLPLDSPDLGHSASAIRAQVAAGRSIRYLVPPEVEAYVLAHGLYRDGA